MTSNSSSHFRYKGFEVKHREDPNSPELYIFNIKARELTDWADVPRKSASYMEGYQRQLKPSRVEDITEYFEENPNHIIPGAVLISVEEEKVNIEKNGDVIDIEIPKPPSLTTEELIELKFEEFYERLSDEEQDFVDDSSSVQVSDLEKPYSYLANVTKEFKRAKTNFDRLPTEDQNAIKDYLKDANKPGLILDGQHRVYGAKHTPEDIQLPVILIPGLEKREQVFQFYVVNNKADPLTKEQLLITVATSLSESEVDILFDRLDEAGVDAYEARLTYRADTSPKSPYAGLVNYEGAVDEQTGVIKYKVLNSVIDDFVHMKRDYRALHEGIDEWRPDKKYEYRLDRFFVFWGAIRSHYNQLWSDAIDARQGVQFDDAPNQLFRKATLRSLQDYLLESLLEANEIYTEDYGEGPILANDDLLRKNIERKIEKIHPLFFRKEWEVTGLSTNEGRDLLKNQLKIAADTKKQDIHKMKMFIGL